MADKKTSKTDKHAETIGALTATINVVAPPMEEGTVLRFDVPVTPRHEGDSDHLTYVALYVADQWFLSGEGTVMGTKYRGTFELLQAMTRSKAYNIELATKFRRVR